MMVSKTHRINLILTKKLTPYEKRDVQKSKNASQVPP